MRWFKLDRSQMRIDLLPDGGGLFLYRDLTFRSSPAEFA
jgi:hypothetical protein